MLPAGPGFEPRERHGPQTGAQITLSVATMTVKEAGMGTRVYGVWRVIQKGAVEPLSDSYGNLLGNGDMRSNM